MYLLDSDVLINAKNAHYAFDLVPGFWRWLEAAHLDGRVFTVEKVVDEVMGRGDELSEWMGRQPDTFKLKPTASQSGSFTRVSTWATQADYRQGAADVFLDAADYYLVAQALALGYTVVTQEKPAQVSQKRIKIPDACGALGVPCVSLFDMLKRERANLS